MANSSPRRSSSASMPARAAKPIARNAAGRPPVLDGSLIKIVERRRDGQDRNAFLDQGARLFIICLPVDRSLRDEAVVNSARFLGKARSDILGRFENVLAKGIDCRPNFEVTPVEQSNRGLGLHLRRRFGQLFACPACDGRRHDRFAHLCRPAKRANYKARLRLRVKNRAALKPTFKFMAAHATQGKSDHNANPARSLSSLPLRSSSYSSSQSPICIL